MGALNERPDFIVRRALASAVQTARHISAAIPLGFGLGAGSIACRRVALAPIPRPTWPSSKCARMA
jgi:hypothetical protein